MVQSHSTVVCWFRCDLQEVNGITAGKNPFGSLQRSLVYTSSHGSSHGCWSPFPDRADRGVNRCPHSQQAEGTLCWGSSTCLWENPACRGWGPVCLCVTVLTAVHPHYQPIGLSGSIMVFISSLGRETLDWGTWAVAASPGRFGSLCCMVCCLSQCWCLVDPA